MTEQPFTHLDTAGHAGGPMTEQPFTHLDTAGHARMVDVTAKQPTVREATAAGLAPCSPHVVAVLHSGDAPKGNVLAVARTAGISAVKHAPQSCCRSPT
jgi:cyclic pyranopterin phosphate synthase